MTVPTINAKKVPPAEPAAATATTPAGALDAFAALLAGVVVPVPGALPLVAVTPVTLDSAETATPVSIAAATGAAAAFPTPQGISPFEQPPSSPSTSTPVVAGPPSPGLVPAGTSSPGALPARPSSPAGAALPALTTPAMPAAPAPPDEHPGPASVDHPDTGTAPAEGAPRPVDLPPPAQPLDGPPALLSPAAAPPGVVPQVAGPPPEQLAVQGPTRHVRPALIEAAKHLKSEGGKTSLVIRLDPPELGAVLVRLTVRHGQVDVQLRTPDLAARGDLQAQAFDVKQILREQGLNLASFDVAQGDVLSSNTSTERETPDRATPRPRTTADGRSSTAHVMDDVPSPQPAGTWL
jgi:flagellar hook-length control protein FliK